MTITLTREEAQQVLDAFQGTGTSAKYQQEQFESEIKAMELIEARLAQPEPEPEKCILRDCENHKHQGRFVGDLCSPCHAFITRNEGKYSQAYRNAQREWQGLTDEEIKKEQHHIDWTNTHTYAKFARAIEAKLKEKNT